MKTENLDTMLYYVKESGISTENITSAHYKENSILLKRKTTTKTTCTVDTIYVTIDSKSDTVVIKDENTYQYINLENNDKSYIFNLQTLIIYRVLNKKLNVSTMSVSQTVKDKKDIVKFNSTSNFSNKEKINLLNKKSSKVIHDKISYDVSDNYVIYDGIPESDKVKVLK